MNKSIMSLQDKVEFILLSDPKMSTRDLIQKYCELYTKLNIQEIYQFLDILALAYVPSIVRYAAKYRQKLGVRDEVRQKMAEQQRRYWPEQPDLEANPPSLFDRISNIQKPEEISDQEIEDQREINYSMSGFMSK